MTDPDKKGFFKRWLTGMKNYSNSVEGVLLSKMFFLSFVVVGLFIVGLKYWFVSGNFWMGVVLVGFGFVTLIDLKQLYRQFKRIKFQSKLFKGGVL